MNLKPRYRIKNSKMLFLPPSYVFMLTKCLVTREGNLIPRQIYTFYFWMKWRDQAKQGANHEKQRTKKRNENR